LEYLIRVRARARLVETLKQWELETVRGRKDVSTREDLWEETLITKAGCVLKQWELETVRGRKDVIARKTCGRKH